MNYFEVLKTNTETGFWINNPTDAECEIAMQNHAQSCTTNPAYCAKLLTSEKDYIYQVIDEVIEKGGTDDSAQAYEVYKTCVERLLKVFEPIYKASNGQCGFVTIQDDPRIDEDAELVIEHILENRELGENVMAKIPVIQGGIDAIEACVKYNIPICATEVFAIAQMVCICERYQAACEQYDNHPPIYVTHISGIFDEYLGMIVNKRGIDIAPEVLKQAGIAIARKQYKLMKERGYKAILLGGGARDTHHFTDLVGGDAHITINWSTAQTILESGMQVENAIGEQTDDAVIEQLRDKIEEFKCAYDDNGLTVDEFAGFGPVQLFRNAFLKGWYELLAAVAARRHDNAIS